MCQIIEAFDILEALEAENSSKGRERLLESSRGNEVLEEIFEYTYSWKRNYDIYDKFSLPRAVSSSNIEENWKSFKRIIELFSKRILDSNSSIQAFQSFSESCSLIEQKWYNKVIKRDLNLKISQIQMSKIWPNIPILKLQKAMDYLKDINLDFPIIGEPLLEGLRCIIIIENGKWVILTKNGKELNLPHITEELSKDFGDGVLDGKISSVHGDESVLYPKIIDSDTPCNYVFHAFNFVSLKDFEAGGTTISENERFKYLKEKLTINNKQKFKNVFLTKRRILESVDDLEGFKSDCINEGYKGIILKSIQGGYWCGYQGYEWLRCIPHNHSVLKIRTDSTPICLHCKFYKMCSKDQGIFATSTPCQYFEPSKENEIKKEEIKVEAIEPIKETIQVKKTKVVSQKGKKEAKSKRNNTNTISEKQIKKISKKTSQKSTPKKVKVIISREVKEVIPEVMTPDEVKEVIPDVTILEEVKEVILQEVKEVIPEVMTPNEVKEVIPDVTILEEVKEVILQEVKEVIPEVMTPNEVKEVIPDVTILEEVKEVILQEVKEVIPEVMTPNEVKEVIPDVTILEEVKEVISKNKKFKKVLPKRIKKSKKEKPLEKVQDNKTNDIIDASTDLNEDIDPETFIIYE